LSATINPSPINARKNTWGKSALDGLMMGLGFSIVLIILGAMRELIGSGTLFDQSALLLGDLGNTLSITIFEDYQGTLLAILPPVRRYDKIQVIKTFYPT
jgi:electron transport complex protein RnfE